MKKRFISYLVALSVGFLFFTPESAAVLVDVFEAPGAGGYTPWNHPVNVATRNAWLAAIGETPDFCEDWDGLDWQGNPWTDGKIFDIQNVPTAIFTDGITFGNIGAQSDRRARAENSIGGTDAIDLYGWLAHESGIATVDLSENGADYISFFIFDTDHNPEVVYKLTFSDGTMFSYPALPTNEDRYRFVGFVNRHPSAFFTKLEVSANDATRYGIDEFKWGRGPRETTSPIPEPSTLFLFLLGGAGWIGRRTLPRFCSREKFSKR